MANPLTAVGRSITIKASGLGVGVGPQGPGQTWRGEWDSGTQYEVDDLVEYEGSVYICTQAVLGATPPPALTARWDLYVARGLPGTGAATTDAVTAGLVDDSGSDTRQALDDIYAKQASVVINVADYGAVGNGVVDDTAAITAAFTAAENAISGGSPLGATALVYFRAGRYIDSASRVISTRIAIRGEGKLNTYLYRKNESTGDYITLSNQFSFIDDVTIDGNRVNCPSGGDNLVLNAFRVAARNVHTRNAKGNGVTIGKSAAALGWEMVNLTATTNTGYGVLVSGSHGSTDGVWLGGDVGKSGLSAVRLSTGAQNLTLVHTWGSGLESATDNYGFYIDSQGNQLSECQAETNLGSGVLISGSGSHGNRFSGKVWGNNKSGIKIEDATKGTINASVYRNACLNTGEATTNEYAAVHNDGGTQWSFCINAWDDTAAVPAGSYDSNAGDPGNFGYTPTYPFLGRASGHMYQSYAYAEESGADNNAFAGCVARKEDTVSQISRVVSGIYNRMDPKANDWGRDAIPSRSIVSGVVRCPPEADTVFVNSNAVLNSMTGGFGGRVVTLIWSASSPAQVTHGTGSNQIYLAGTTNWTPPRWSSLTCVYDGASWHEIARKVA